MIPLGECRPCTRPSQRGRGGALTGAAGVSQVVFLENELMYGKEFEVSDEGERRQIVRRFNSRPTHTT